MEEITHYTQAEATEKLHALVKELNTCLFSTNLKNGTAAITRPMTAYVSDKDEFVWFFSQKNSNKNKDISTDSYVQLYFADMGKSTYFSIAGNATVVINDRDKIEELWNPFLKTWFQEGKDDPSLSLIKVTPDTGYYWDTKGNRIINFLKMAASLVVGKDLVAGEEGKLKF